MAGGGLWLVVVCGWWLSEAGGCLWLEVVCGWRWSVAGGGHWYWWLSVSGSKSQRRNLLHYLSISTVATPPVTSAATVKGKETLVDLLYSNDGGRVVREDYDRAEHVDKGRKSEKQRDAKVINCIVSVYVCRDAKIINSIVCVCVCRDAKVINSIVCVCVCIKTVSQ